MQPEMFPGAVHEMHPELWELRESGRDYSLQWYIRQGLNIPWQNVPGTEWKHERTQCFEMWVGACVWAIKRLDSCPVCV
jgi:hypothetical protein